MKNVIWAAVSCLNLHKTQQLHPVTIGVQVGPWDVEVGLRCGSATAERCQLTCALRRSLRAFSCSFLFFSVTSSLLFSFFSASREKELLSSSALRAASWARSLDLVTCCSLVSSADCNNQHIYTHWQQSSLHTLTTLIITHNDNTHHYTHLPHSSLHTLTTLFITHTDNTHHYTYLQHSLLHTLTNNNYYIHWQHSSLHPLTTYVVIHTKTSHFTHWKHPSLHKLTTHHMMSVHIWQDQ